jgi:hypothetical protein
MCLYLVEGSPEADKKEATLFSSYTAIEFLTVVLQKETREFAKRLLSGAATWGSDLPKEVAFARNPNRFLEDIGAFGAPWRNIHVFFRRRVRFGDTHSSATPNAIGVIGYPLVIYDAD